MFEMLEQHDLHGSSPLARGTVLCVICGAWPVRFIPAGAGNRQLLAKRDVGAAVHPRWRGEQLCVYPGHAAEHGSSPLARGTARLRQQRRVDQRFIPAGAGNSQLVGLRQHPAAVHPRWRGEQVEAQGLKIHAVGSSPLARGTADRY